CGELSPSRIRERPARACPNSPSRTKGVSGYSRFSGPMATGFSSANSWCARRYEDDPLPARCLGNNLVPALVQGPSRLEPHHEYTQGHPAGRDKRAADDAQHAPGEVVVPLGTDAVGPRPGWSVDERSADTS